MGSRSTSALFKDSEGRHMSRGWAAYISLLAYPPWPAALRRSAPLLTQDVRAAVGVAVQPRVDEPVDVAHGLHDAQVAAVGMHGLHEAGVRGVQAPRLFSALVQRAGRVEPWKRGGCSHSQSF